MQQINQNEIEGRVDARYRIFLILWAAISLSVLTLVALCFIIPAKGETNDALSYSLLAVGIIVVAASVFLKQQLTRQAVEKASVESLQTSHVLGLAFCESAALLAFVDRLMTSSNLSWFGFGIAVLGLLMHFPKKEHLRAVLHKRDLA